MDYTLENIDKIIGSELWKDGQKIGEITDIIGKIQVNPNNNYFTVRVIITTTERKEIVMEFNPNAGVFTIIKPSKESGGKRKLKYSAKKQVKKSTKRKSRRKINKISK
jgi:hypothetical protein